MKTEDLETLRRSAFIRAKLQCKHSIQADLCDGVGGCQGITRDGKTIDEVMDGLEKRGFLKKVRSVQKIGRIVGKTAFWVGKGLIAGGVTYVIYVVGKEIYAFTESKRKKKEKK